MNRPNNIEKYEDLELKLGIKSSLPKAKEAIALLLILWECNNRPYELVYGEEVGGKFVPSDSILKSIKKFADNNNNSIKFNNQLIFDNCLYEAQIEHLQVAFELIWKLARVIFINGELSFASERTGGNRYAKKLLFSSYVDILHECFKYNIKKYYDVLLNWIGCDNDIDNDVENQLIKILTILSEFAVYRLQDDEKGDIIFNLNGVYDKVINSNEVDINGDKEPKGSLRILKTIIKDGLNSYLMFNDDNKSVIGNPTTIDELNNYKNRVSVMLKLNPKNTNIIESNNNDDESSIINPNSNVLTPEYVKSQAHKFVNEEKSAQKYYQDFYNQFNPEKLKELDGEDLLNKLFLHDADKENMCYLLEYKYPFGSIKGGSADKHGLYKKKEDGKWHEKSNSSLSNEEALNVARNIRDGLIAGYELVSNRKDDIKTDEDYVKLYDDLVDATNNYIRLATYRKYFHYMFPDIFPPYYNKSWTQKVLDNANIEYINKYKYRYGKIQLFINECEVSDYVFDKVFKEYLDGLEDENEKNSEDITMNDKTNFNNYFSGQGINLVIYGTPGCGKSFELNKRIKNVYKISDENIIRTTFYHDYSNTDFIGQIIPYVDSEGNATYKQNPGPFTKALCKAYNSKEDIALVIEELNRGDAASIFGDIFQLLDRFKDEGSESYHKIGVSEYAIENSFIQQYLKEKTEYLFNDIRIPSNLYIFATMNTSDQNVFTLDTAFKRRWNFEKMTNDYDNYDKKLYVPGIDKTWIAFVKTLNKTMLELNGQINEDKQFGLYFVDKALLRRREDVPDENKIKNFAYKVFEYLWDDVVRFDRDSLFNNKFKTLDDLIDEYIKLAKDNEGMKVFNTDNLKEVND